MSDCFDVAVVGLSDCFDVAVVGLSDCHRDVFCFDVAVVRIVGLISQIIWLRALLQQSCSCSSCVVDMGGFVFIRLRELKHVV